MTLDAKAPRRLPFEYATVRRFFADGLALFGALVLFGLYILPQVFHPTVFVPVPNALPMSMALTVASMAFVGWRALQRTPMDLIFMAWIVLAIASQLFASSVLNRQISEIDLYLYLVFIMAMWAAFRAGFALTKAAPDFAPIALIVALIFILLGSAVLGILQSVGPVKQAAIDLGLGFSGSTANVLEGAEGGRPTGVFGGPNILGYANDLGAICLVAIGTAYARVSKPWQVFLIMAGLGVFGYSTLLAQSRVSLLVFCAVVLFYGLALRRKGASAGALATFVALFLAVAGVGVVGFQVAKLNYVEGTFQNDLSKDPSFVIRQMALEKAGDIAVEIAPLGTAVGQANQINLLYARGYDPYWTFGVDNEWVNIYLAHGVWGPVFLALFFVVAFRGVAQARNGRRAAGRLAGSVATACLVLNLAVSMTGVRIGKYDTGIYTSVLLGAAFASAGPALRRRPQNAAA